MISADQVSAVLPTRGDVDLDEIRASLPFEDVVVWDNSADANLLVYGRYMGIQFAKHPVIYTQDDDVVLMPEAFVELLAAYEPKKLTANMPQRFRHDFYQDHCLVGLGAIFDRHLPALAFERFGDRSPASSFYRTCDIVFTGLTERKLVDVPYKDLPWYDAPTRMWKQPQHVPERSEMLRRVLEVAKR